MNSAVSTREYIEDLILNFVKKYGPIKDDRDVHFLGMDITVKLGKYVEQNGFFKE